MFVRKRTYEALRDEHARLTRAFEQAKSYLAHYKARERDVSDALVAAQAEGRRVREEAEIEARAILARARDEAAALKAAAAAQVAAAEQELRGEQGGTAAFETARAGAAGSQAGLDARHSEGHEAGAGEGPRSTPVPRHGDGAGIRELTLLRGLSGAPVTENRSDPARKARAAGRARRPAAAALAVMLVIAAGAATQWWNTGDPNELRTPAPSRPPDGANREAAAAAPAATSGSVQPSTRLLPVGPGRHPADTGRPSATRRATSAAAHRAIPASIASAPKAAAPTASRAGATASAGPDAAASSSPGQRSGTDAASTVAAPPLPQVQPALPPVHAGAETLAAATTPSTAAPVVAPQLQPPGVRPEENVLSRHREYFKALSSRDAAGMQRFTADGFSATIPFLEGSQPARPLRIERESIDVRGVGAVVSGMAVETGAGGTAAGEASWLFSEVWINRDGQWLLLNVRFAKPPAAN